MRGFGRFFFEEDDAKEDGPARRNEPVTTSATGSFIYSEGGIRR